MTLFRLKKAYPREAPKDFDNVEKWKTFLEATKAKEVGSHQSVVSVGEVSLSASNANYVAARALRTQVQAEMATIQLEVTKRNIIRKEECKALFAKIAAVVRGRFLKVRADLPCSCVGLTEAEIEKVVAEKIEYALSALDVPTEFFEPQSVV